MTVAHIRLITGLKDINTLVNTYANFTAEVVVEAMQAGGYGYECLSLPEFSELV